MKWPMKQRKSRVPGRLLVLLGLLARLPARLLAARRKPDVVDEVLVLHHLLLGDAIMQTSLLAKLRRQYPAATLRVACPRALLPLYAGRPYGITPVLFDPRDAASVWALFRLPRPDLAILPAENRYSLLAAALGARWIRGFEDDGPSWKNRLVDELIPWPAAPEAWPDMAARLVDGPAAPPYRSDDWPAPPHAAFDLPGTPYCVLHLGAGSVLRQWAPERWRALAQWLAAQGFAVAWSAGKGEEHLVRQCDPEQRFRSYAGLLDLPQLWHLLANAALLVSPDTGVAHLGKAAGAPCVTLFGPGSAVIYGSGDFWSAIPYRAVTEADFPCRDERVLFERLHVAWVRHCARSPHQCPAPACMQALSVSRVETACREILQLPSAQP